MLVEGLSAFLAADVNLAALLNASTRSDKTNGMFPTQAPDEVPMPYIVYSQVSGEPLQTSMAGTGRLQTARWRFSCYGTSYKSAKQLAYALVQALLPMYGVLSAGDVMVQGSWLKLELDSAEPISKGVMYSTHVDFEFVFLDTKP